jgi:hypothetical protein
VITMVNPSRTAMRAIARWAGLAAGLCGLVLLTAAPSLAARTPSVAKDRVSFAMRGPLKTGSSERLLFTVHHPAGQRPTVFVHLTMPGMAMQGRTLRAKALGHGRYSVRAPLTMPGRWVAHVTVTSGGASVTRVLPFHTIYGQPTPWRTLGVGFGIFVVAVGLLTYRLRRRPTQVAASEPNA